MVTRVASGVRKFKMELFFEVLSNRVFKFRIVI